MRAVVTGMGAVTGLGLGVDALRRGLQDGTSGVRRNTLFVELDRRQSAVSFIAVPAADGPARADRFLELAVLEAAGQAQLFLPVDRTVVFLGSAQGNIDAWSAARNRNAPETCDPLASGIQLLARVCTTGDGRDVHNRLHLIGRCHWSVP